MRIRKQRRPLDAATVVAPNWAAEISQSCGNGYKLSDPMAFIYKIINRVNVKIAKRVTLSEGILVPKGASLRELTASKLSQRG